MFNRIFFIHIPKSAGTSFRVAMEEVLGQSAVAWHQDGSGSLQDIKDKQNKLHNLQVIGGHYSYRAAKRLFPGSYTFFATLRDPIDRAISLYNYILSTPIHHLHEKLSSMSMLEALENVQEFSNQVTDFQCNFLSEGGSNLFGDAIQSIVHNQIYVNTVENQKVLLHKTSEILNLEIPASEKRANRSKKTLVGGASKDDAALVSALKDLNRNDIKLCRVIRESFANTKGDGYPSAETFKAFFPDDAAEPAPFSPYRLPVEIETTPKKGRVAIVCWDLSNKHTERSALLYDLLKEDWDVELVGPVWKKFGQSVWKNLFDSGRNIVSLLCENSKDFYPAAKRFAQNNQFDFVVVSKPRAPSMVLGALIKQFSGCPVIVDIDCDEALIASQDTVGADDQSGLLHPYEKTPTADCSVLIEDFDAVTVSNSVLRKKHTGILVRNACAGAVFSHDVSSRAKLRETFKIKPDDFVVLSIRAYQAYQGLYTILDGLDPLAGRKVVVLLVGDVDTAYGHEKLKAYQNLDIRFYPNSAMNRLTEFFAVSDIYPVFDDVDHPMSKSKSPEYVSEALAVGVPVIATDMGALRDLASQGVINTVRPEDISQYLEDFFADRISSEPQRALMRSVFETELSLKVNAIRLEFALQSAFENNSELSSGLKTLIQGFEASILPVEVPVKDLNVEAAMPVQPEIPDTSLPVS